jgi:glycosyltransferase involved in cell wall biosynthesis
VKKIVQVVDALYTGGAERVAVDLANGLKQLGFAVFFCVTRSDGPLRSELSADIPLFNLKRRKRFQGLLTFRRYVLANGISVVHAHGNHTALFCVLALAGIRNVEIIHHDHNSQLRLRNVIIHKLFLRRVDHWIVVSEDIRQWVIGKIKYGKALLMINPIVVSRFSKTQNENREVKQVVMLANYREPKDYENLLNAVHHINNSTLKFTINCFGSTSDEQYFGKIQARLFELNLQHLITLNSSATNVPVILSQADIGLLTSSREGLPISLLEYMASSLPVVSTDVGECKRIVSEANCGIVVPHSNPTKLAEALQEILFNTVKWKMWGLNAKIYVEQNHSMEAYLNKMVNEVYQKT